MSGSRGRSDGVPGDEVLPCGRLLSVIWDAGRAGTAEGDPHVRSCPSCTAALRELRALDRLVEQARATEGTARATDRTASTTDRTASAGGRTARTADRGAHAGERRPDAADGAFTARVMERVRRELRPGRTLPLGRPGEDLWIVEAAVAKAFRAAVETLPGVRAGGCRVRPVSEDGEGERGAVVVCIDVVTCLEHNLQEVAEAVRHRVTDTARRTIGLPVHAVDVTVADLLDDGGRAHGTTFGDAAKVAGPGTGRRGTGADRGSGDRAARGSGGTDDDG